MLEVAMTERELHDYQYAMLIVNTRKPLLSLTNELELHPELVKFKLLLDDVVKGRPRPYRGNRKLTLSIPEKLRTKNLNKAIRYGYPLALSRGRREGVDFLEELVGIAMAGKIVPNEEG